MWWNLAEFNSHWWSWWFVLEDIFTGTDDPGDLYWKTFSQPLMILVICTGRYCHSHWWSWWFVLEDIFTATDDPGDLHWKIFSQPLMILVFVLEDIFTATVDLYWKVFSQHFIKVSKIHHVSVAIIRATCGQKWVH